MAIEEPYGKCPTEFTAEELYSGGRPSGFVVGNRGVGISSLKTLSKCRTIKDHEEN